MSNIGSEKTNSAKIISVGTANPPFGIEQEFAASMLSQYYKDELFTRSMDVMQKVFEHPSIKKRYLAVSSIDELVSLKNEDPDRRIERFTKWAVSLSSEAIDRALDPLDISYTDVTTLIVNTCTGYICPGIATYLIEACNLSPSIKTYDMVGTGCAGAIPNLQLAQSIVAANPDEIVLSVSVEICSATFEMGNDMSLIVSNAIFGDGAAAAVIMNGNEGLTLKRTKSFYDPAQRDDVRYVYKKGRLNNRLSPQLPDVIGALVPPLITELLSEEGLSVSDVKHWSLHPGGDKMIENLQKKLELTTEQMQITRAVLSDFGNMSSPTVLFGLERILEQGIATGEWCLLAAYGAGLAIHSFLLQQE